MSDHLTESGADTTRGVAESTSRLKRILKRTARGIARLLVVPLYLSYRVRRVVVGDQAFRSSSQQLSLLPGLWGDYLRGEFYRLTLADFGLDVQVAFGSVFSTPTASVGDHVYIGPHCVIGNAAIGADVLLGSNVQLLSGHGQHGMADVTRPMRLQPGHLARINIGEDTWIGNGSIVMAHIGRKCVVGAGSVVASDIPDLCVAAGNPARILRSRAR